MLVKYNQPHPSPPPPKKKREKKVLLLISQLHYDHIHIDIHVKLYEIFQINCQCCVYLKRKNREQTSITLYSQIE